MILDKNDSVTVGRAAISLAVVASINALVSIGFAFAYVIASPSDPTAGYALVRTVVLAVALAVALSRRSATAMMVAGLALTLAQAGDAIVGFVDGSLATAFGPLAIALVTLVCLIFFSRAVRRAAPQS
jgi:hypothetical protein